MEIQDFIVPGLTLVGVVLTVLFNWRRDVMNANKSERDQKLAENKLLVDQLTNDYSRIKGERDSLQTQIDRMRVDSAKQLDDARQECDAKEKRLLEQIAQERAAHETQVSGMKERLQEKDVIIVNLSGKLGK